MNLKISSYDKEHGAGAPAIWCSDLPNPHIVPAMRKLTGKVRDVQDFVSKNERAAHLLRIAGTSLLTFGEVTFACDSGKDRSVAMAEVLADHMRTQGHTVVVVHRDL